MGSTTPIPTFPLKGKEKPAVCRHSFGSSHSFGSGHSFDSRHSFGSTSRRLATADGAANSLRFPKSS